MAGGLNPNPDVSKCFLQETFAHIWNHRTHLLSQLLHHIFQPLYLTHFSTFLSDSFYVLSSRLETSLV